MNNNDNTSNPRQPDHEYWALRKPNWEAWKSVTDTRLWCAVALACDLDPSNFQLFDAPELNRRFTHPTKSFEALLERAKINTGPGGMLKLRSEDTIEESEVSLSNFRKWAKSIGVNLPHGFPGKLAAKEPHLEEEKPLGERERATLLTLIAALAHEAGIDIAKPSKAAGLIEGLTLRIEKRIAARTIEEHLKRIPAALEKRSS